MIQPLQGRVLIELKSAYKNFEATEERFGTSKTRGVLTAIAPDIEEQCKEMGMKIGDMVYFGKYEDTAPYSLDDRDYVLIKLEEIGGRSDDSD